jgi:hypothetical protein
MIPSLWHVTPSGVSEPFLEFVGSRQSPGSHSFRTFALNQGPFPRPALPGVNGTTGLSATPPSPACPSRASGWKSRPSTERGFPCCVRSPYACMPSPLPRRNRRVCSLVNPCGGGLPRTIGGSASASKRFEACSAFTHVTACMLAESPK